MWSIFTYEEENGDAGKNDKSVPFNEWHQATAAALQ